MHQLPEAYNVKFAFTEGLVQKTIVESNLPKTLGPGLIYHGTSNFLNMISRDQKSIGLTRVADKFAADGFVMRGQFPAIIVVKTDTFHKARKKKEAELTLIATKGFGIDPRMSFKRSLQEEEIEEVWVAEDQFAQLQHLQNSEDLQENARAMLEKLMRAGKIKVIDGFIWSQIKEESSFKIRGTIRDYWIRRNLLKDFPGLTIESKRLVHRMDKGGTEFTFDPKTGRLLSIKKGGLMIELNDQLSITQMGSPEEALHFQYGTNPLLVMYQTPDKPLMTIYAEAPTHTDGAMVSGPGGIDLNPAQMVMDIRKGAEDFKFDFNGLELDSRQIAGVQFNIRQITPVTNLPLILGINS
jgi:hypothetical protein